MYIIVLIFVLFSQEALCKTKVYRTKKTNNEAELYCESTGAVLLNYGTEFLQAAKQCGVTEVLTNKPWYHKYGCFSSKPPTIQQAFLNNHLANCADFCSDPLYDFIGVQTTRCLCFYSLGGAGAAGVCDAVQCTGNANETCGIDHMIVYRKVLSLSSGECHYVVVHGNKYEMIEGSCDVERNFICKDASSTDTECIGDVSPQGLVDDGGPSIGLILGVIAAVLVIIVIVLAVIYFRMRKKKKYKDDRQHIQPRQGVGNHVTSEQFINAYREPSGYNNLRTRDPFPLVAFGGDSVDLDDSRAPVYTAVHKKPKDSEAENIVASTRTSNLVEHNDQHERDNDKSNFNRNNNKQHGGRFQNDQNVDGHYIRKSSEDVSENGLHKSRKRHGSPVQNGSNNQVQNELSQNKMFRNSQNMHGSLDDDLY